MGEEGLVFYIACRYVKRHTEVIGVNIVHYPFPLFRYPRRNTTADPYPGVPQPRLAVSSTSFT